MRLGKMPARQDPRTFMLKALAPVLPAPPPARDWASKLPVDLGMMVNDQIGDCTCAGAAHMIQTWTADAQGHAYTPSDDEVVAAYSAITGYDPEDASTDNGANMLDVLNYWRQTGVGAHRIGAYAALAHRDVLHVESAIASFGGVYVGVMLPVSAQNLDSPWAGPHDIGGDNAPGSWGGHCMACVGYDIHGVEFVTWGQRQRADWLWWTTYVDEAYAIFSRDWIESNGSAPSGLNVAKLQALLTQVGR
jgi:hypothetical protein